MRIVAMPCTTNATVASRFPRESNRRPPCQPASLHISATELLSLKFVRCQIEPGSQRELASIFFAPGESQLPVLPNESASAKNPAKNAAKSPAKNPAGTPLPDSKAELPPVIRRAEVVAFALVGLLVICIVAVLYVAKAFFLPIVSAFVVGTMLSPAAGFLERRRIPRPVSAVLIVASVGAGVAFMVGLISSPLMEWSTRLPELGSQLKDKLHVFDRPLALWRDLQAMVGVPDAGANGALVLPKFDWVEPTVGFLSPTFTEFLLFIATLILFIASWRDLRRALVMTFGDHSGRLRMLRILNEIEAQLGGYLLTVTMINFGVGVATGITCAVTGMPNAAGLGALAAALNFFPIIGPVAMFVILAVVGVVTASTIGIGLIAALLFVGITFLEGHFVTPTIIGRRLELNALAVFMALAFWTWLWGPMGGFLSSPLLIVALVLKEHLTPEDSPQLPPD